MKKHLTELRRAVMVMLIFAVVCCGLYPLIVFGVAQVFFRDQANGSLIVDKDGTVHGSKLLGQQFTTDKYFQSRPSAAGNGYDATSSGGSNLGPTSSNLVATITQRIADYRTGNGLATTDPVSLGFIGEPGVNVLMVNLALDRVGFLKVKKGTEKNG